MKRTIHFHPVLFALSPPLSLYALNRAEVAPGELTRPLCVIGAASLLLLPIFWLVGRRDWGRAALALSATLFAVFSYTLFEEQIASSVQLLIAFAFPAGLSLSPLARIVPLWLLITVGLLVFLLRGRFSVERAASIFLVLGCGIVGPTIYDLVRPLPHPTIAAADTPPPAAATVSTSPRSTADPKTPDLYCIVLDAYARTDQLKRLYGMDNRAFLGALETRGFRILNDSHANYLQTVLALSSLLNLDYLPSDPHAEGIDVVAPLIATNRVTTLLKARGYQIIDIPSDFAPTTLFQADTRLNDSGPIVNERTALERLLISRTLLAFTLVNDHPAYDKHRMRVLGSLRHVADAARIPGPKFVFVHVLAPHPPFVIDADGNAVYPEAAAFSIGDASDFGQGDHTRYQQSYKNQLLGLNPHVLDAVDAIQKTNSRPAVIFLLGDHGSRMGTDWKSRGRTDLQEAFSNLQAVYVPGGAPYLTDDLTPINTLRLLLTHEFGERFPRLPDKSFYSTLGSRSPSMRSRVT